MADDTSGFRKAAIEAETAFEAWPASHALRLSMADPHAGLLALLGVLGATEARLESLVVKPSGPAFEAMVRFTGMDCEAAREVADRLDGQHAVTLARIEHHLFQQR